MKKLSLILLLMATIMSAQTAHTDYKIMSVSDYPYTMGGKQSVSIAIGSSDSEWVDITVHRDQIKQYNTISRDASTPAKIIDATAHQNGKTYYFITKGAYSDIYFNILEIDKKHKVAKVAISLDLYNTTTNQYFRLQRKVYTFKGKNYKNLVKHIR